jgi:hypothetical protein
MRDFLGSIDASIHIPMSVLPIALRSHDCVLMDDVISNDFSTGAVKKLNLCQLFLQVELLSEICSPTGDCILDAVWHGERPLSKSKFLWPCQACPHEPSWRLWRRFLKLVYLSPSRQTVTSRSKDLRLEQALGSWIGTRRHLTVRCWRCYLSGNRIHLYHYQGERLLRSTRANLRTRFNNKFPRASIEVPSLLSTIPVVVTRSPTVSCPHPTPFPPSTLDTTACPIGPLPDNFFDFLQTLPIWQLSFLEHHDPIQAVDSLHLSLESGDALQLYFVSNDGAKDDLGSFGWELSVGRTIIWACKGPTFGLQPGSFRAKSYGMLSVMLFLHH